MDWSLNPKTSTSSMVLILVLGVLCLLSPWVVKAASDPNQVIVEGHIYENIYLAISPDTPMTQCAAILDDFKLVINEATALLFNLSGQKVTFPHLFRVVLPSTFTECGKYWTSNTTPTGWQYDKAPLRLGTTHPLFGDSIWTQQPGQCGDPGDYISMTPDSLQDTSLAARQLVAEWAKYRWGVMEEGGHQGDTLYPPAYEGGSGGQYFPTACSDTPLNYTLTSCATPTDCEVTVNPIFNPTVTSSILSLPQLPTVNKFCTSTTHDTETPTKQNLLCSRLSTYSIFERHSDYLILAATSTPTPTVEVTAVLEAPVVSSIVVVVENTVRMTQTVFQKEFLVDAVCQTIISYLEDGIYFGLIHFGSLAVTVNETSSMMVVNSTNRQQLCTQLQIAFNSPANDEAISIGTAIASATEILPPESSIVLITMPGSTSTETASSVVEAAGSNSVWPVLYPVDHTQDISWFVEVAEKTGGASQSVAQTFDGSTQLHSVVRRELSKALMAAVTLNQDLQLVLTDDDNCITNVSPRQCSINMTGAIETPSNGYLVSAYYQTASSVHVFPADDCVELAVDMRFTTSATYYCPTLNSSLMVEVTTPQPSRNVYAEVIALELPDIANSSSVTLWTSSSLKELRFTNTTAPSIFAKVMYEGRQVVQATVSLQVDTPSRTLVTLQLRDDGTGADVTGNDGIYSTFLVGVPSNITEVSAGAMSLAAQAAGPGFFMPDALVLDPPNQCCGSLLSLPSPLEETPSFTLNGGAEVRVTSPPVADLPPGRVSDVAASTSGRSVRLTFTAPGADLDHGTVSSYEVAVSNDATVVYRQRSTSGLVSSGLIQTIDLDKFAVGCDNLRTYVVSAFDDQSTQGAESNMVRYTISCSAGDGVAITAGAIVGIVIGGLLLIILICLILYIGFNWEDRDDLWVWWVLTCGPCLEEEDDKSPEMKHHSPKKTTETLGGKPVTHIRSVEDLYAKPDKSRRNQGGTSRGVDNRGFDDVPLHGQLSLSVSGQGRRRYSDSSISSKEGFDSVPYDLRDSSLQTTLPINRIGIPVPEFAGAPLHEERLQEQPNTYPIYPEQTPYANPFADPLMDDPYQQPYSPHQPEDQFQGYQHYPYGSGTNSPSAPSPSRLNTQV